jgi:peptidoglycan/xylan/chitin deacetylase (PgdA/CDA1 family)
VRWVLGLLLAAVLPVSLAAPADSAPRKHQEVVPCSRGLVALTFDDGPSTTVTPKLVRLLLRLDVPATFFMVGSRVVAAPDTARLVERAGFAIGNHTWLHTDLTTQSKAEIRTALRSTHQAMVDAGLHPTRLARPPYGAVDDRVRRVLAGLGLVPVLWTIDSRDWTGLKPGQIRDRVLDGVHRHSTNVVLQHDGVTNSPATLRALPGEIATLRARGFCFAGLDEEGNPTPPVPVASVSTDVRHVDEGGTMRVTVRLDRPTSRPTTALVAPGGSATSGSDFDHPRRTVRFGVGERVAHLWLRVRQDRIDESTEDLYFKVYDGNGVQPALVAQADVRIRDDDPPPTASVVGGTVTASPLLDTTGQVQVRLDGVSGRDVRVRVRAGRADAWVTVPAGERTAALTVTVPPEGPGRRTREIPVRILTAENAERGDDAALTVRPPDRSRSEVVRAALAGVTWPVVAIPGFF